MRHAILDENYRIINIIEVEPDIASHFNAHYLGDNSLSIGDLYPDEDFAIPIDPTEDELLGQQITELQLDQIEQGQFATELQLQLLEANYSDN